MFSIVHFTDTDDVALVPTTWVSNGRTGWPSYRNPARLTKSVKDREEMGDDWKTFSCRVLSVTGKCVAILKYCMTSSNTFCFDLSSALF